TDLRRLPLGTDAAHECPRTSRVGRIVIPGYAGKASRDRNGAGLAQENVARGCRFSRPGRNGRPYVGPIAPQRGYSISWQVVKKSGAGRGGAAGMGGAGPD